MATEQAHDEWGSVRVKISLLFKIDELKGKHQSRSDYITTLILKEIYK